MGDPKVIVGTDEPTYGSVDEMVEDGATEVQYAYVDGFKKEGGRKIRIGSVSAGDMIEWSEANETEAKRTAGLRLITRSLVNSQGVRISSDKDIVKLRTMRHDVTERIVKEILKLNGMNVKADNAAKND
jgi:hypothetical protein